MILKMTEKKAQDRPSAPQVINEWLTKWRKQLEDSTKIV